MRRGMDPKNKGGVKGAHSGKTGERDPQYGDI